MRTSVYCCFLSITVLISGCSYPHFYYSPNSHNVPLFSSKNDFAGNITGSLGAVNAALEVQAGVSLPAHLAFTANYMTGGNKHSLTYVTDLSKVNYFEGGAGLYTSFSKTGVFEIYGGFGKGSQHHEFAYKEYIGPLDWEWVQDGKADILFSKAYIQPDVGFKLGWIDAAFSCRLTKINYTDVDFRYTAYRIDDMNSLIANSSPWFIEPAFTLRGGQESVKFQFQIISSKSLSGDAYLFEPFRVGFGVYFNIGGKQITNQGQTE